MQNRFCIVILFFVAISSVFAFHKDINCEFSICRGDFPAFYAAWKIAAENRITELYSVELQSSIEQKYWPSLGTNYLFFSYPPFVATLLSPLANFSPVNAKLIWIFISFSLIYVSIRLQERTKSGANNILLKFLLLICFPTNLLAIASGQAVAISIFLFSLLALFFQKDEGALLKFRLGFVLGLFVFKPNYLLILLILLLPLFSGAFLLGLILSSSVFYVISAVQLNIFWPFDWLLVVKDFAQTEIAVNGYQSISIIEIYTYFKNLFNGFANIELGISLVFGILLIAVFFSWYKFLFLFIKNKNYIEKSKFDFFMILLISSSLLLNLHALFYELGIMLLPILNIILSKKTVLDKLDFFKILIGYLSVFLLLLIKESLPIQALILLPLGCSIYFAVNANKFFQTKVTE